MRKSRLAVPALFLSLVLAAMAGSVGAVDVAVAAPGDLPGVRGVRVTPESFNFSALPPATGHFGGPVREKPAPQLPDPLLKFRPAPKASELTNVTIDPTAPPPDLAPILGTGFEGIQQTNYIPGEPTVAAGPLNIFTTGNVDVRVVDKDGAFPVETDGATFFGVPSGEGAISDPVCFYDALRGRFLALAFTQGNQGGNKWSFFYLAISQTNDARGAWWRYRFDQTKDGTNSSNNWSDFEDLGISDDKLAMSSQQFSFGGGLYKYQKVRVIDRALAYTGAPVDYVDFYNFAAPPGGDVQNLFVTKPGRNISAGDATIHLFTTRYAGGSNVAYREITGPPASPVLSAGTIISVNTYGGVVNADQLGGGTKVAAGDSRTPNFYVRNGLLTAAWHFGIDFGSGTVDAIRLFQMRTSDLTVLKDETFGADGIFYIYPACTVDSAGSIFIGFDRMSANEYPSCYVSGRRRADVSIEPSALIKAGLSETSQSRWGDYTGIDMDESLFNPSSSSAWYAGQWTKNPTYFGTWVNKMTFTYGVVAGNVLDDCDGTLGTTGDRTPLAGVTLTLKQGATPLATTTSNSYGYYSFGYLETGVYDVVVTAPAGGGALDAFPGAGGNSQTRVSSSDLQVNLTNAQTSSSNVFVVTSPGATPVPPLAIADLSATPVKTGNDADGTTRILISFTPPAGADSIEVWRKAFGNYPQYDDPPGAGSVPAIPSSYPPSGWTRTAVAATSQVDEPATRDYWYYVAYSKNSCGAVSAVSNRTGGTLNYHLGDVCDGVTAGQGDNRITTADASLLGIHYGETGSAVNAAGYLDVGPTTTGTPDGRPTTDDSLGVSDLAMFSLDYYPQVSAPGPAPAKAAATTPSSVATAGVTVALTPVGPTVSPGAEFDLFVEVTPAGAGFNAFDAIVAYDPSALTLIPASPATLQETPFFHGTCGNTFHRFRAGADRDTITDVLLCDATSVTGPGQIYRLHFRAASTPQTTVVEFPSGVQFYNGGLFVNPVTATGDTIHIGSVSAVGEPGRPLHGLSLAVRANPSRAPEFLAGSDRPGPQEIIICDLQGRVARHLQTGSFEIGSRLVRWDGRNDAGEMVAPGIYFVKLFASGRMATARVTLLN